MLKRAISSSVGSTLATSRRPLPNRVSRCRRHYHKYFGRHCLAASLLSRPHSTVIGTDRLDHQDKTERELLLYQYANQIVDVSDLACSIRKKVRDYQKRACNNSDDRSLSSNKPIQLVGILADDGSSPYAQDAKHYSGFIRESCQKDGILYKEHLIRECQHPWQVEQAIRAANDDDDVHGILVYYPIFKSRGGGGPTPTTSPSKPGSQGDRASVRGPYKNSLTGVYYKSQDDYLRDVVLPSKDVEGLCHEYNARWLFRRNHRHRSGDAPVVAPDQKLVVFPCTALAVYRILEQELKQKQASSQKTVADGPLTVTIINRSEIFGRPLAAMMANHMGATVYSVDINSILRFRPGGKLRRMPPLTNLEDCLKQSSVVVTAVPHPKFRLPIEAIQRSSIVVNVASAEFPNVDETSLLEHVKDVKYVPNVGKVTTAILLQNLTSLHRRRILEVKRLLDRSKQQNSE